METRRLAVILSHLSGNVIPNSDQQRSRGSNENGPMVRKGCSGKDVDRIETDELAVCCRENNTGSSNSGVILEKADAKVEGEGMSVEQGENFEELDAKGSCGATNKATVRSQTTRSHGIISEHQENCVFCDIVRGRSPALKLYEDGTCICILDINPLSHGHSLIIPKTHYSSLEVTPPAVAAAMCAVVPILGNAIMKATCSDSFNLLVNNGAAAGQEIFHTHFHIIPRSMHDKLWRSENARRRPLHLNQETALLAECIRGKLSALQT